MLSPASCRLSLLAILWCAILGCTPRDRVIATVNGKPIVESEIQVPEESAEYARASNVPAEEMAKWTHEMRQKTLEKRIHEVLEESALNEIGVTLEPAEVDQYMEAFREYVASIKPGLTIEQFGRQSNARIKAWDRLRESPDKTDEIYAELLAPLGMDREELDVSVDALPPGPYAATSPETEAEWRELFEQQLLRLKKLSALFGVPFEISSDELNAFAAEHPVDDQPISMRYAAYSMIRDERIRSARAAWVEKALADADVRIRASEFEELDAELN